MKSVGYERMLLFAFLVFVSCILVYVMCTWLQALGFFLSCMIQKQKGKVVQTGFLSCMHAYSFSKLRELVEWFLLGHLLVL